MNSNQQSGQLDQQSGGQQMFSAGDYNTGNISSWIKATKDPQVLAHIAREVFTEINNLNQTERDRVFSTLRNDVKFQNVVDQLSPQTT